MSNPYDVILFPNLIELLYTPISIKLREAKQMSKAYVYNNRTVHVEDDMIQDAGIDPNMDVAFRSEYIADYLQLGDVLFRKVDYSNGTLQLRILEPTEIYMEDDVE